MDPIKNPFTPGAGCPPYELAGRADVLEEARILLGRTILKKPEKSMLLTGLRGVGKTVLLNNIEQEALKQGYRTINFEVNESMIPASMAPTIDEAKAIVGVLKDLRMKYHAAIKEISTKLEVLDLEFSYKNDYNPIHHMQCRIKSVSSIMSKIERRGMPAELKSLYEITDFAGVRVICKYLDDIYAVENSLLRQDDIKLVRRKDYIKNPKESGYRSLHLIVEVPVFLSDRTYFMPVEIQIRTIAMDTWASLEHELKYKATSQMPESVAKELQLCAKSLAEMDATMQRIHKMY